MKIFLQFSFFCLLSLSSFASEACSCMAVTAPATSWVKDMAGGSTYIFYGTVQSIGSGSNSSINVKITKNLKGKSKGSILPAPDCMNYKVKVGDTRVFFVSKDSHILGCSNYKDYLTDFGMLKELQYVLKSGT